MIIPDLNLLVYGHDSSSAFHARSKTWWESLLNGAELVAIPWAVVVGFLRLTTSRTVFSAPLAIEDATRIVTKWFESPSVRPAEPGPRHLALLAAALRQANAGAKLVTDAHLAAIAMELRATLHSHDRDFQRFSGLLIHDPLASRG